MLPYDVFVEFGNNLTRRLFVDPDLTHDSSTSTVIL